MISRRLRILEGDFVRVGLLDQRRRRREVLDLVSMDVNRKTAREPTFLTLMRRESSSRSE